MIKRRLSIACMITLYLTRKDRYYLSVPSKEKAEGGWQMAKSPVNFVS